ncbi:MAG: isoprenylcysteine carboxylmethyltransferase family protein [Anaerolineae bacterium]
MTAILKRQHGMTIVGQGGVIILFTLPWLAAALVVHRTWPQFAALPAPSGVLAALAVAVLRPVGWALLMAGAALWGAAIVQLLTGFSQGRLVTTGAYGVVRNPIYASAIWFLLPGTALATATWVYLVPALALYTGVMLFIGAEEQRMLAGYGEEYREYTQRVHRIVPFRRPAQAPQWRSERATLSAARGAGDGHNSIA